MKTLKRYIYLLALLCCMAAGSCSSDDEPSSVDGDIEPEGGVTYWYYSYEAEKVLGAEDFGMEADSRSFLPYAVAHVGDTLFVSNSGDAGCCLLLYSRKNGRLLGKLKSWTFNGKEMGFNNNPIEAIVPAGGRLYVAERQSRIHVFTLPGLEYISCIGNGQWNGQVFQVQALAVTGGLIYARDKDSRISIYRESDVTPENFQNIKRWKHAAGAGDHNNGFNSQCMVLNEKGNILLTAYEAKAIRTLAPSLVNDGLQNNTSIDIEEERLEADFKPWTLTLTEDKYYVTGDNKCINVYNREQKTWGRKFKSVKGYTFGTPARIYGMGDGTFWVSDTEKRRLVKLVAYRNEIHEYERVSASMVRVCQPDTRSGQPTTVLVDLQTHEVVSEN